MTSSSVARSVGGGFGSGFGRLLRARRARDHHQALVRNTGAAITAVVGFVLVLSNLAGLLPGSLGAHVNAYLPANAGRLIMSAHQQSSDLLSPWQGFSLFCAWTIALLGAAVLLLNKRDV